jgi:hypothetical protein
MTLRRVSSVPSVTSGNAYTRNDGNYASGKDVRYRRLAELTRAGRKMAACRRRQENQMR